MPKLRECKKCKRLQPLTNFHRSGKRRRHECSDCRKLYLASLRERPSVIPDQKMCTCCGEIKPAGEYSKDTRASTGLMSWCSACNKEYKTKYRKSPLGKLAKIRENEAIKRRPKSKLTRSVSRAVWEALKLNGVSKEYESCWEHIGYTKDELRAHLEAKFVAGMTWENYGSEWHLDHIVPKSRFVYNSMQDHAFRLCWGLDNLQPLWKKDNLSKGARTMIEYKLWTEQGK